MSHRKKTSIALCTYNGEKYLAEQLDSYLSQTSLPDEIIICDDASKDTTSKILNDFKSKTDIPVKIYINKTNLGYTKNFEKAISLCSNETIFLSDQDDVWANEKISRMISLLEQNSDIVMAFSDAALVDENLIPMGKNLWDTTFNKRKRKQVSNGKFYDIFLKEGIVTGATVCFKSDLRDYILPIPILGNFIHDGWIALVAAKLGKVAFLPEALIKYRQHSNQQIGASIIRREQTYSEIRAIHEKDLEEIANLLMEFNEKNLIDKLKSVQFREMLESLQRDKADLIRHLDVRINLPKNPLRRLLNIYAEVRQGSYHRFERGLLTAGKDVFNKFPY